jgi:hypothetical protein
MSAYSSCVNAKGTSAQWKASASVKYNDQIENVLQWYYITPAHNLITTMNQTIVYMIFFALNDLQNTLR